MFLRSLLLACLALAAMAAELSIPELVGPDLDRRWAERQAKLLALRRASSLDAWEAIGMHGDWDPQIRELLNLIAEDAADMHTSERTTRVDKLLFSTVVAACPDPLVRYFRARVAAPQPRAADWLALAGPLAAAGYPPVIRFCLARRTINAVITEGGPADPRLSALWQSMPALMAPLLLDTGTDYAAVQEVLDYAGVLDPLPEKADFAQYEHQRDMVLAACDQGKASAWWRQQLLGTWYLNTAYNDRKTASVEQHLRSARECLLQAWNFDPSNGRTAVAMMKLCANGGGLPGELRLWRERAMATDPFNHYVYTSVVTSQDDIDVGLDAAMGCVATKAWSTPIPEQATTIIFSLARRNRQAPQRIWGDARTWTCLETLNTVQHDLPGANPALCDQRRLLLAWRCGQHAEAIRLWERLGAVHDANYFLGSLGLKPADVERDLRTWADKAPSETPAPRLDF
jgi:hypothetical protein